jgi:hypothetical protein
MYVPENDPNRSAAQQEVIDAYNAQFGAKAQWDRNYQFVLQNTGDPEKARIYADSIASTQNRQELTQLATGVAGPAASFGREAIATARALRGAAAAEEAPGAMRLLAGPSRRNAQTAEEMLTPDVIPMGGPSFNTPRLTYAKPETRYRMALDRTAEGRPLANYDRPAIDTAFVRPEDVRPFNAGNVRGTVDPLDVLAAEGGQSSEAVALAQRLARQKAEGRAATVVNEESRFAGGEGPNYAEEVLNRRRLAAEQQARAAEQEARFQSGQVDAMANEGGGAGRQAMENELNRAARADFEARQLSTLGDEAGAITSGRNPPQPVARALQVVEREAPAAAAPGPGTGFTMIDTPGQGFTMTPPSRAMTMRTVGSEAAGTQAPASAWYGAAAEPEMAAIAAAKKMSAGTPSSGSYLPLFAATTLGGTALLSGQQQLKDRMSAEADQQAAIEAARKMTDFDQSAPNTFNQQEAMRIASVRPEFNQSWSNQVPVRPAVSTAAAVRSQQAAPTPMMRPESSPSPKDSILSRIFSGQDYQSSGPTRGDNRLYQGEKDGRKVINWGDPESAADFFRASKAQQDWNAQSPDSPSIGAGMKRGGAAGKPDSVHKALEIIHHLLTRSN